MRTKFHQFLSSQHLHLWYREQELCHLRGAIQLGPMPLLRQEREL